MREPLGKPCVELLVKAKRASLTPQERKVMIARQGGLCFTFGCGNGAPFIAEHWWPVSQGNDQKPDCLLCKPCAYSKSYGLRGDISTTAHIKRLRKRAAGETKKKRPIPNRGFDKTRRKKMSGEVVKR